MNEKFKHKALRPLLIALALLQAGFNFTKAANILDQQQLIYDGGLSARTLPGYTVWQSFTAGLSGTLAEIDMGFFNDMSGTARLEIFADEGTGGALLQSLTVPVIGFTRPEVTWNTWSVNVPVQAGLRYTFNLTPISALPDPYGVALGSNNPYPGGVASGFAGRFDLVFRTFVDGPPSAPAIVTPPANTTVELGVNQSATFFVFATGGALNYQWRRDGSDIEHATNAVYTLDPVRLSDQADYSVVVSNSLGSVTNAPPAHLTVIAHPVVIETEPVSQTLVAGQLGHFSVAATGSLLSYQWFKDGVEIPGATSAVFNFIGQSAAAGIYKVVVTNPLGTVTSAEATLTVLAGPPASGAVFAWGSNRTGALNIPLAAQSDVVAVAAGGDGDDFNSESLDFTLALKRDGTVLAWGYDRHGETDVPLGLSGVVAIGAGADFSAALKSDGSVVVWGETSEEASVVPDAARSGVVAIAAGLYHMLALKSDGSVLAWGRDNYGETSVPAEAQTGVVAIAAGDVHSVALKADGSVVVWGHPDFAQAVPPEALSGVKAIAAGQSYILALKNDGSVLAWGADWLSDLSVPPAAQNGVVGIAAHRLTNLGLKNDGIVVAWGRNDFGQTDIPTGLDGVIAMAEGYGQTVVVVGNPSLPNISYQSPSQTIAKGTPVWLRVRASGFPLSYQWRKNGVDIPGATLSVLALGAAQFSDAGTYTVVVSNPAGHVESSEPTVLTVTSPPESFTVVWGLNDNLQKIPPAVRTGVQALSLGGYEIDFMLALKTNGTVVGWPSDNWLSTIPPEAQQDVLAVSVGGYHAAALKADGSVVVWGDDSVGQLETPVVAQTGVIAIAAGGYHTAALKRDGSVVTWGNMWSGPAGPVPARAQNSVIAIAAGTSHTVALRADGTIVMWTDDGRLMRVPPEASQNVIGIAAGGDTTAVLEEDGTVVLWGDTFGEVYIPNASKGALSLAVGDRDVLFITPHGALIAWGDSQFGEGTAPTELSRVFSMAAGRDHSAALIESLPAAPTITQQPISQTVDLGQAANFSVTATGSLLSYQWRKDGIDIPGATDATYSVDTSRQRQAGDYTVEVSNFLGSVTSAPPATLAVIGLPPVITAQPPSQTVELGQTATFTVTATGSFLSYQWRRDGIDIAGATSATYKVAASQLSTVGNYTVVVTNPIGSVTSAPPAALTVTGFPPAIAVQPVSQTVELGQTAILSVSATGNFLSYQWRKDGINIVGATSATNRILVNQLTAAGDYTVVVSNPVGSVTSAPPAVLTVTVLPPAIVVQPASQTVNFGQTATFTVSATGSLLNYQWRKDEVNILGATGPTYSVFATNQTPHSYTVVISNSLGSVTSSPPAVLTVNRLSGTVVAWGNNFDGKATVPLAAQTGAVAITAGDRHTVVLKEDGSVLAWGDNQFGQTDVPAAARSGVVAIAAGGSHTMALKNDGSVLAWGWVWNGTTSGPVSVPADAQTGVVAIAAGYSRLLALKSDGSVVAWGDVPPAPAGLSGVTALAAGGEHMVALKNDGSVVAWGNNQYGQTNVPSAARSGVRAIAAGIYFTLALKTDGSVVAWGQAYNGQAIVPVTAPAEAQSGVIAIVAGAGHAIALKNNGSIVQWAGGGYAEAEPPQGLSDVTAIAAGFGDSFAILGSAAMPPALQATTNGNLLLLSWPANATGFKLQATPVITANSWSDVTTLPVLDNARFTVAEPIAERSRYYRLVK